MLAAFAVGSYGAALHEGRPGHVARGRGQAPRARGEVRARSQCSGARRRLLRPRRPPRPLQLRAFPRRRCACRRDGRRRRRQGDLRHGLLRLPRARVSRARPSSATRPRGPRASRRARTRSMRARCKGKGAMPAKGGNPALSDADVTGRRRLHGRRGEVTLATYAIGDLQGCYEPLARLVDLIAFDSLARPPVVRRRPRQPGPRFARVPALREVARAMRRVTRPRQPRPAPALRRRGRREDAQARHARRGPRRARSRRAARVAALTGR